jgi:hypothetical protein
MKSKRRKQKKDIKAAQERLMEALRAIEKAALGDENPTRVNGLAGNKEMRKQTQASDNTQTPQLRRRKH